jgi:hypothetical protein
MTQTRVHPAPPRGILRTDLLLRAQGWWTYHSDAALLREDPLFPLEKSQAC